MSVDVLDIVAVILGVLFTIRKLDAQRRTNQEFSHVEPSAFKDWQEREVMTFQTAMIACFAKVLVDWGFLLLLADELPREAVLKIGATIDLSWVGVMILTFVRTHRLTKLRIQLRIVLGGFIVESESELSDELKSALNLLKQGDVERASYQLRQVILDADESLRAIALYWLGECYLREGKEEEARDAFVESLELDPSLKQPQDALHKLDEAASKE